MPLSPELLLESLSDRPLDGRVLIGFSGGLDSSVLLDLAVAAGLAAEGRLLALHINHGLQVDAEYWVRHCQRQCRRYGVPIRCLRAQIDGLDNLEARARDARYALFTDALEPNDRLLLGHHADDQAETLLLRLLRGGGVRGLAAMPRQRRLGEGSVVRPLLDASRAELESYARERQLDWIDDGSNLDLRFDRNYLRHQVVPALKARWPGFTAVLGRTARLQAEAEQLLMELAQQDFESVSGADGLRLSALLRLSVARQRNLLRWWLHRKGVQAPAESRLTGFLSDLARAADDRQPQLDWGCWRLCRYRDALCLLPYVASVGAAAAPAGSAPRPWEVGERLILPGGELSMTAVSGEGLRLSAGAQMSVGWRQGGERICIAGRSGHRTLKKLLQEAGVPPWQRQILPLIYVDGELAAVADLWLCEGFQAQPGEPGLKINWRLD